MQGEATPTRPAVRVTAGPPPGGQSLPPTIPPVRQPGGAGNQAQATPPPPLGQPGRPPAQATAAPGGQPGAYPPAGPPNQPGQAPVTATAPRAATPVATAATPGARPTTGANATPAPTTGSAASSAIPAFVTLTGRVVARDGAAFEVEIPGRGTVTVSPGPDTDVRRDGAPSSVASLSVGENVTLVLGDGNQLLRILVLPEAPAEPEAASPAWAVFWQGLLGLVMMGVVLMIDSELREKFVGALIEPSRTLRRGRGPRDG